MRYEKKRRKGKEQTRAKTGREGKRENGTALHLL
jgi:hypothetical protein